MTSKLTVEVDGGTEAIVRSGTYKIVNKEGYSQMEFVFPAIEGRHKHRIEFVFYSGEANYTKIDIFVGIWFLTGLWPEGVPG